MIISKTKLRNATYSVKKMLNKSNIKSYQTRYDAQIMLGRALKDLQGLGFVLNNIRSLKPKHITGLVKLWTEQNKSPATIKNNMSKLRLTCRLIGKHDIMPKDNKSYNIADRAYNNTNKAITADFSKIKDEHLRFSLKLQEAFGLRREESIKFNATIADNGSHIHLKGSWTKGNIERKIPITSYEQRKLINEIKNFTKNSLIPENLSYKDQLNKYTTETRAAEIKNPHGLRHAYAQKRYHELTTQISKSNSWQCPVNGGPEFKNMTKQQKIIDRQARLIVSNELGHSRISIVRRYIG